MKPVIKLPDVPRKMQGPERIGYKSALADVRNLNERACLFACGYDAIARYANHVHQHKLHLNQAIGSLLSALTAATVGVCVIIASPNLWAIGCATFVLAGFAARVSYQQYIAMRMENYEIRNILGLGIEHAD